MSIATAIIVVTQTMVLSHLRMAPMATLPEEEEDIAMDTGMEGAAVDQE
jgi:hypothetical protein